MLPANDEGFCPDDAEEGEIRDVPMSFFAIRDDEDDASGKFSSYRRVRIKRKGGISIDMCNFQSIGEVGDDAFVKVGSGVTRNKLNDALRWDRLLFLLFALP
jgi:hypothetical protein